MKRVLLWLIAIFTMATVVKADTIYMINEAWSGDDVTPGVYRYDGDMHNPHTLMTYLGTTTYDGKEVTVYSVDFTTINGNLIFTKKNNWTDDKADQTEDLSFVNGQPLYIVKSDLNSEGKHTAETKSIEDIRTQIPGFPDDLTVKPQEAPELKEYDLQILGTFADGASWNGGESQHFTVTSKNDTEIVYSWSGTIRKGDQNSNTFKFGSLNEKGEWILTLTLQGAGSTESYGVWDLNLKGNLNDVSGSGRNMYIKNDLSSNFFGTVEITQKIENNKVVWGVAFKQHDSDPGAYPCMYEMVLVGDENGWNSSNETYKMTRTVESDKVVYTIDIKLDGGDSKTFHFTNFGGWTYEVSGGSTATNTKVKLSPVSQGSANGYHVGGTNCCNWYFEKHFEGTLTLTQTAEGWTLSWSEGDVIPDDAVHFADPLEHTLTRYDLYIRGENVVDNHSWDDYYAQPREMTRARFTETVDGKTITGYRYYWQGTILNNYDFNFGTKDVDSDGKRLLELGFSAAKTTLSDRKSNEPRPMTIGGFHNINFDWANNSEIRITLTQHRNVSDPDDHVGSWTMEWEEVAKPATGNYGTGSVYLHGSEFNAWDVSKRRAFVWDEATQRYRLTLRFENSSIDVLDKDGNISSMVSNVLTNFFYVEAFGKKYTVEGGRNNPLKTGIATQLIESDELGGDHQDNNIILADQALENVTLIFDPATNRLRVEGDKSDNIDGRKYTIYYKITKEDMNSDGSMKDIYLWAWGNGEGERQVLSTLTDQRLDGVDPDLDDNGKINFPGLKISNTQHGTYINIPDEEGNVTTYIRYELPIPAGQSTIGLIFAHAAKDDQTKNILDTEFQDGRVYEWNAVINQGREAFFSKVALRVVDKNGNKAMLLMETEDGNIYTLKNIDLNDFSASSAEDRYVQDVKGGNYLENPIYHETASANPLGDYEGFYIVRTRNSAETSNWSAASIRDYYYYYTHNGGLSYWKTYDLNAVDHQMKHMTWDTATNTWKYDVAATPTADRMMTLNSKEVDGLEFEFELSTGMLTVKRYEENESLVHVALYFHNADGWTNPHILVKNSEGVIYSANNKHDAGDGDIIELGEPMHQDEVRLGLSDQYWRFDLAVPASELRQNSARRNANAPEYEQTESDSKPSVVITPGNYGSYALSNLHFTFTDGDNPVKPNKGNPKAVVKRAVGTSEKQNVLENVPVVNGAVYALQQSDDLPSILSQIYLIDANTNRVAATLKQVTAGKYEYEVKNFDMSGLAESGIAKMYISTAFTTVDGAMVADGVDYGAGSSANSTEAYNSLLNEGKVLSQMTYNDATPYVINLNDLGTNILSLGVEINPTLHTGYISFSKDPNDIETGIVETEDADAPVMWFNMQGVRLSAPQEGLNIRVQGNKTSKVLVR